MNTRYMHTCTHNVDCRSMRVDHTYLHAYMSPLVESSILLCKVYYNIFLQAENFPMQICLLHETPKVADGWLQVFDVMC